MFGVIVPEGSEREDRDPPSRTALAVYVWRYHRDHLGLAQTSLLISAFIVFQVTHSARSY
jgi:hypothetical protein